MDDGEQELVPGEGEDDEGGGGDRGRGQRQGDAREGAEIGRAVDQRGLLEFDRQVEEGLAQDDDDERQDEGGVDQDEGQPVSSRSSDAHDDEERDAVATGGSTRCDRNQTVRSLFVSMRTLNRKRARA